MTEAIDALKIISTARHTSKAYGKIQNRATHGFIFKISGETEYHINGRTLYLHEGEMIFLPKGSSYEYRSTPENESLYTSINFVGDIPITECKIYSVSNFYRINYIHHSISELWKFGAQSDIYACMAVFYDLLSYVSRTENNECGANDKFDIIEPAISYMRKHIYDCDFRIERLHTRCRLSDTYFRKIFKARFGHSPKEYITFERLSHARAIIESGDYASIAEIANAVGYSDPLYFSKAFKRVYGICPSGIDD